MIHFSGYDKATRISASKAGITNETIGECHNRAIRYERRGDLANALNERRKAMEVHTVYGTRDAAFSMGHSEFLEHCQMEIKRLEYEVTHR